MTWTIHHADVLETLRSMPGASFDACIIDPPYGLGSHQPTVEELIAYLLGSETLGPLKEGRKHCANCVVGAAVVPETNDLETELAQSSVTFRVSVAQFAMAVPRVEFNDESVGEHEVHDDRPVVEFDDMLVGEVDTECRKGLGDRAFRLGERKGFAGCVEVCRCFAETSPSTLRVLVRLRNDSFAEAESPTGVVALPAAEIRAVLALDVRGRTGELLPAAGADALDAGLLLSPAKLVGAASGACGLAATVNRVLRGEVRLPADRTLTIDVAIPAALLSRFHSPRVTQSDFMGKDWQVPAVAVWRELNRVLKPGGCLLTFAGSRTGDLISLGLRAARFEIRDWLMWLYGSGNPKGLVASKAIDGAAGHDFDPLDYEPISDLAKEWEGYATGLKPAYEPVILARKSMIGTLAENLATCRVGALAIDASRIATDWSDRSESWKRSGHSAKPEAEKIAAPPGTGINCHPEGRWPANVLLDEDAAKALDDHTGTLETHGGNVLASHASIGYGGGGRGSERTIVANVGGASRFFYVAKASRAEREAGCGLLPKRTAAETTDSAEGAARLNSPRTGAGRTSGARNYHPTVKPVALDRWLAGLLLPPPRDGAPRRILVPYAGSGTEMIGAILAGWDEVVGIEREPLDGGKDDYLAILKARVGLAATNPRAFDPENIQKPAKVDERQVDLFGGSR